MATIQLRCNKCKISDMEKCNLTDEGKDSKYINSVGNVIHEVQWYDPKADLFYCPTCDNTRWVMPCEYVEYAVKSQQPPQNHTARDIIIFLIIVILFFIFVLPALM
jgi:hypothetical protein